MPYSNRLPNDPKNPNKKREVAARKKAEEEAKKQGSITAEDKKGREVELDPNKVEFFPAVCADHGSLGNYLRQEDATNAENLHQQRVHRNSPHVPTKTVEEQRKRNWHGDTVRDKKGKRGG
jgi:hypothetical protein